MSESILDHGYVPEEHAPDPVTSHGDPTPPGKIAIWLFLASEIMFFIGILGSYIVLRSGAVEMFARHAQILSKTLAGVNTIVLILSSVTMYIAVDAAHKGDRKRVIAGLAVTLLCAFGFMGIKYVEYMDKFHHYTIVAGAVDAHSTSEGAAVSSVGAATERFIYDGHVHSHDGHRTLTGYRIPMQPNFDIHRASASEIKQIAAGLEGKDPKSDFATEYTLPAKVSQEINYGPWKNVFFASYFTTTGVHGVHVVGGMIPITILLVFALKGQIKPAHTEYVGLYWHFVDLVWIFLFPLLYLI